MPAPRALWLSIIVSLSWAGVARAQAQRVVVLYDERVELPGLAALDANLTATLRAGAAERLEIYRESLDLSRFGGGQHLLDLREHLRRKYAVRKIDAVVTVMSPALDFMLAHGQHIFPGTPIIFCAIDRRQLSRRILPERVTGVLVKRAFRPSLDIALRLHPNTRRVFVIGGTSDFDRELLQQASAEFRDVGSAVQITYLTGLAMPELLDAVSHLPAQSVILYSTLFRDAAGEPYVPHEVAERIAAAANAPVYAFVDQYLGSGIVGGRLYSIGAHGEVAGRIVLQVLGDASAVTAPPVEILSAYPMFDWRQLRRWRIDLARLPAGSIIRYRTRSAWDLYHWYIVGAVLLALLQAAIILALSLERSHRRRAQKRYALASAAGGVGVWDWNLETHEVYIDPLLKSSLGYQDGDVRNHMDGWLGLMHPDDVTLIEAQLGEIALGRAATFEVEHRMLHRDGTVRWYLARGSVTRSLPPVHVTGTETDITERKHAHQALHEAQAELIRVSRLTALGEFAASIAHEVRQPLTSIRLNVQACLQYLNASAPKVEEIRAALLDVLSAGKDAEELMLRNRQLFRMHAVAKEPLDINDLVVEVKALATSRLLQTRVALHVELTPGLPLIQGDRIELQQVLLNLIANAIDATQHLPNELRRVEISTMLVADSHEVQVAVRDNGVGLNEVDMQRLFTLSYTTKPTGTGIGLSLCRSIVEAHGGRIVAESHTDGRGATFSFLLPAARPVLASVAPAEPRGLAPATVPAPSVAP